MILAHFAECFASPVVFGDSVNRARDDAVYIWVSLLTFRMLRCTTSIISRSFQSFWIASALTLSDIDSGDLLILELSTVVSCVIEANKSPGCKTFDANRSIFKLFIHGITPCKVTLAQNSRHRQSRATTLVSCTTLSASGLYWNCAVPVKAKET